MESEPGWGEKRKRKDTSPQAGERNLLLAAEEPQTPTLRCGPGSVGVGLQRGNSQVSRELWQGPENVKAKLGYIYHLFLEGQCKVRS